MPPSTIRLQGLDTLRACAIVLVLVSHYAGFVSHAPTFGILGNVGWSGVDLFFVLSGYLIGNQLLAPVARGETSSTGSFFARRLLRTLPNYYAMLAIYLLLPHGPIAGSGMPPLWQMLTFTQNIGLAYGQTFTHSWSLCIEEQFYVVLPLAVLALARVRRPARLAWCVLLGAAALGVAARAAAMLHGGHDAFAAEVYYSTLCRFGGLLPGVAIAMLKNFHPTLFARLQAHANAIFAAGLATTAFVLHAMARDGFSPFVATTFGFPLVAAGFGLLVLSALGPHCILNRVRVPGAASLALWSYAVYLAHKPIFMAIRPQAGRLGIDTGAPWWIGAIMAAGIGGGWLLYRLVETPFMRLRERWYPARPAPAAAAAQAPGGTAVQP
ncbi:acyltransferase [Massilia sp. YIM B02763]|uniref:acyltransferase family protein n=1 Tax=Massilia sp. YIM B02763 TaxID=3050130 RepID=UPI0025B680C4|nr:acyltransferase [Massilia sp. YIM B02763]MDN4053281.1 acyltransferase [Massilia sp. YIM B02763]